MNSYSVKNKNPIWTLLIYFLLYIANYSQSYYYNLKFDIVNQSENLSHNSTVEITQDGTGYLWISTVDGLNRFDKYECKIYRHIPKDSTSLTSNRTGALYCDSHNNLWIGTVGGGANRMNLVTGRIVHFMNIPGDDNSISSNFVTGFVEDNKGNIWCSTKNGLNVYSYRTNSFKRFLPGSKNSPAGRELYYLLNDNDGRIWITSIDGGLSCYDPGTDKFKNYLHKPEDPQSISTNNLTTLAFDKSGKLWIGTYGSGVNIFDPETETFTHFRHSFKKNSIPHDIVYAVYADEKNNMWIGTRGGLSIYLRNENKFVNYHYVPDKLNGLSSDNISGFFKDRNGELWILTYGGGIDRVIKQKIGITLYRSKPGKNSLSNNFVTSAAEYKGNLVVGTVEGISLMNITMGNWKNIFHNANKFNSLTSNSIGALTTVRNNLWVGTRNDGINVLNASFDVIKKYNTNNSSLEGKDVIKFYKYDQAVWVLSADKGIFIYYLIPGRFGAFPGNNTIVQNGKLNSPRAISIDENYIWVGYYKNGLWAFDKSNYKIVKSIHPYLTDLDKATIWDLYDNGKKELWICTDGKGVFKLNTITFEMNSYSTKDGLANDVVYAIKEDDEGNYWFSTNNGVSCFNPAINKFTNYNISDGLQGSEFNYGAAYKTQNGEIIFGGVNGFNVFSPGKINFDEPSKIVITNVLVNDKNLISDSTISYKRHLYLDYTAKVLTFEISSLNYSSSKKENYYYMLDGFDAGWTNAKGKHSITYTNLEHGNYILMLKGEAKGATKNLPITKLYITVVPPFYITWWFRTIYILFLLSLFVSAIKYYSTRKLKKRLILLEKQRAVQSERERISRDLHDNIGSRLTFIISSFDNLIYSRNSNGTTKKITQLRNYSRSTLNELRNTVWAMKSDETLLRAFVVKIREMKNQLNNHLENIKIEVKTVGKNNIKLNAVQSLNIFRIIEEAIQNSVKYSGGDKIIIKFNMFPEGFELTVKDNGCGFDPNNIKSGEGLHNMQFRCEEAGGIFKINSGQRGTEIKCRFTINNTNAV